MPQTTKYKLDDKTQFSNNENIDCDRNNPSAVCKLGQGKQAILYLSNQKDDKNKNLAYKYGIVDDSMRRTLQLPNRMKNEYDILEKLKKKDLCTNFVCAYKKNNDGFYMKYLKKYISLRDCIRNHVENTGVALPTVEKKKIAKKLIRAVNLLHENNIAHCDLKPENIMVNLKRENGTFKVKDLKIIDFGGAIEKQDNIDKYKLKIYTPMYTFLRLNDSVDFDSLKKHDLSSLGLILIELIGQNKSKDYYERLNLEKSQMNIFKKLNRLIVDYYKLPEKMKFFEVRLLVPKIFSEDLVANNALMSNRRIFEPFLIKYILVNNKKDFLFTTVTGNSTISVKTGLPVRYTGPKVRASRNCPAGKEFNRVSNRCKKIKAKGPRNPCADGKIVNPKTNRCVKKSSITTVLPISQPNNNTTTTGVQALPQDNANLPVLTNENFNDTHPATIALIDNIYNNSETGNNVAQPQNNITLQNLPSFLNYVENQNNTTLQNLPSFLNYQEPQNNNTTTSTTNDNTSTTNDNTSTTNNNTTTTNNNTTTTTTLTSQELQELLQDFNDFTGTLTESYYNTSN